MSLKLKLGTFSISGKIDIKFGNLGTSSDAKWCENESAFPYHLSHPVRMAWGFQIADQILPDRGVPLTGYRNALLQVRGCLWGLWTRRAFWGPQPLPCECGMLGKVVQQHESAIASLQLQLHELQNSSNWFFCSLFAYHNLHELHRSLVVGNLDHQKSGGHRHGGGWKSNW